MIKSKKKIFLLSLGCAKNLVDSEHLAGFGVITPYASPMPNIPQMGAVWGSWGDSVQLIMNGEDVTESLTNGAEQIRDAIASE